MTRTLPPGLAAGARAEDLAPEASLELGADGNQVAEASDTERPEDLDQAAAVSEYIAQRSAEALAELETAGASWVPLTLDELLAEDSPAARLTRRALLELLTSVDGPMLKKWRALRQKAIRAWRLRVKVGAWKTFGAGEAVRRDGVELNEHRLAQSREPHERHRWGVWFPPVRGGAQPYTEVVGASLAAAMAAVDQRFPMADWWLELDLWKRP